MTDIAKLLQEMRPRVAMYIGSPSLTNLAMFLEGYCFALRKSGIASDDMTMRRFDEFVRQRYQVSIGKGWDKIIEFYTADASEAMSAFWELFDDFMKQVEGNDVS